MKKFLPIFIFAMQVMAAQTVFQDNFTVTGGGDVNFQYENIGRQTGAEAPANYYHSNGPSTVTNAGANAGECKMDGMPLDS